MWGSWDCTILSSIQSAFGVVFILLRLAQLYKACIPGMQASSSVHGLHLWMKHQQGVGGPTTTSSPPPRACSQPATLLDVPLLLEREGLVRPQPELGGGVWKKCQQAIG